MLCRGAIRLRMAWGHRVSPLLRRVAFRRYWLGQSLSLLGGQIGMLAFPLTAVLVLKTNALGMALITAVGALPSLVFSMPIGAWVDRYGHQRKIMMIADVSRALLIALIPIAFVCNRLSLPLLIGVWFMAGIASVFFRVSSNTLFVALVPSDMYADANGLLQQSQAAAFLIGPALGGWLIETLSAAGALLGDALSFLMSALSLALIQAPELEASAPQNQQISEGIAFIRTSAVLRSILSALVTQSAFRAAFMPMYILYATRDLFVTPAQWGIILGPSSILALWGPGVTRRLSRRLGIGVTLIVATILVSLPLLVVPLLGGVHLMVVGALVLVEGVSGAASIMQAIMIGTVQAAAIPNPIRARVMAVFTMAGRGMTPFGAGLAALCAWTLGLHTTVWVSTVGLSLSFLWLLTPEIRSLKNHEQLYPATPDAPQNPAPTSSREDAQNPSRLD